VAGAFDIQQQTIATDYFYAFSVVYGCLAPRIPKLAVNEYEPDELSVVRCKLFSRGGFQLQQTFAASLDSAAIRVDDPAE